MKGKVIIMGDMEIDGETVTGVFIECDKEEFNKETVNLLYQEVEIKPTE